MLNAALNSSHNMLIAMYMLSRTGSFSDVSDHFC
jgi:hypothetical protein